MLISYSHVLCEVGTYVWYVYDESFLTARKICLFLSEVIKKQSNKSNNISPMQHFQALVWGELHLPKYNFYLWLIIFP